MVFMTNGTVFEFQEYFIVNIYVGNLSYQVTDEDLRAAFENYGEVSSAKVIVDKFSNRSKGFGFVEMASKEDAEAAIKEMHDSDIKGRQVVVNEARPRNEGSNNGGFRRNDGFGDRGDRQRRF
ncbi:RNA recognition motif domain-containing protein [Nitrosococcus oceani]|uniref:RNA recognition motif domain-containing protein n=1 Tax=Nitrosococcus oceani TaxID=1229 RepID=UPI0004E96187|nr:RNA-binding protein [Nitrosococcus oceani]KFI21577.1 RNA-binding protein [Nitrosococcus oceani]